MRWADLPERYGKSKSVHKRFMRWAEAGVWDRLFDDLVSDRKHPYLIWIRPSSGLTSKRQGRKKRAKIRLRGVPEVD
jgi:transposase